MAIACIVRLKGMKKPASEKAGFGNSQINSALATDCRQSDETEAEETYRGAAVGNTRRVDRHVIDFKRICAARENNFRERTIEVMEVHVHRTTRTLVAVRESQDIDSCK